MILRREQTTSIQSLMTTIKVVRFSLLKPLQQPSMEVSMMEQKIFLENAESMFRYSVIESLLSLDLKHGELSAKIKELSEIMFYHPLKKQRVQIPFKTIERWYYKAKNNDNIYEGLSNKREKTDRQIRSISEEMIPCLEELIKSYPEWSKKLLWENWLVSLQKSGINPPYPSYSTALRFFKEINYNPAPKMQVSEQRKVYISSKFKEKRSFREPFVGGMYHLDFHTGNILIANKHGLLKAPKGIAIKDSFSGFVCHFQWYFNETAESLIHALSQAFMKYGKPKKIMADNGSAMISKEYTAGLIALGIEDIKTPPYSPWKNGKIERYWQIVEKRLIAMLKETKGIDLHQLNTLTQIWLTEEYHNTIPQGCVRSIHDRFLLTEPKQLKDIRNIEDIKFAFMRNEERKVKKEDGTISLNGITFELPAEYKHLQKVTVRFASWDLSKIYLISDSGVIFASAFPLNAYQNASGIRRKYETTSLIDLKKLNLPPLLEQKVNNFLDSNRIPGFFEIDEKE